MKRKTLWMLATILICGVVMTLTSCSKDNDNNWRSFYERT